MPALSSVTVEVDDNVTGHLWSVEDMGNLAKLIALIALGQAQHAAEIILALEPLAPAISIPELYHEAQEQLRIRGTTEDQKKVSRYHRDGFLFECMSWIIARQSADNHTYLKDPHISSTTQGLDGLMIQMNPVESVVVQTTICEDKCTQNPRKMFRDEVLVAFSDHHQSKRGRDLLANAVDLIKQSGLTSTAATKAAGRVINKQFRTYRAALTVDSTICTPQERTKLFKGYDTLTDITQVQRVGATFIVEGDLRTWFQILAEHVIKALEDFEAAHV
ncbi:MAG: hypothetical protein WDZ91_12020 [Paenibacillaceae bacterium]